MIGHLMLSALLAAAPVGPGVEADWVIFLHHVEGGKSYYDRTSIQREGQIVRAWVRWDRSSEREAPFGEARILNEMDCTTRTATILRHGAYDLDGTELFRGDDPLETEPIPENRAGGALALMLCPAQPAASGQ